MYRFIVSAGVTLISLITAECSVVVTSTGPVRGKFVEDEYGSYYAYMGIPYAESPEGDLRFKPPIPKKPWTEVLNATEQGPVCPQPEGRYTKDQMSEDCLFINILVPANRTYELLPVFAFIHGGAFKANSGNIDIFYGPQFFLKRNIIYMSMNHRLGALGYLSLLDNEHAPGNSGMKDVLLALRWINNNIHVFGGNSITIGGQSSGAAIVHYLLLTDKSEGLFHRAILNSGSATNFRFLAENPKQNAFALADKLGGSNQNIENVIQTLINADVFDIIHAQETIYSENRNPMRAFAPFVPCVEKESDHAILINNPRNIIKAGIPRNIPILAGSNKMEGAYMWPSLHKLSSASLKEKYPLCIPPDIHYPRDSDMYTDLVDSVSKIYFGGKDLSNWTLTNFYNLITDTQYAYSVDSWIKMHKMRRDSAPLYYYLFDFDGDLNWAKLTYNIEFPGAVHADDLGYLFVTQATQQKLKNMDERSKRTLNHMLTLFSNFIKHGNPTPDGFCGNLTWPESGKNRHHLVINDHPKEIMKAPNEIRFRFWEEVYKKYNERTNSLNSFT